MIQARKATELDYAICTYPGSSLRFRGPARRLTGDYVAVIGGSEVFGRYVSHPFTHRLQDSLGLEVVNLGVQAGGLDVFLRDGAVRGVLAGARAVVVQVLGAHNLSNRLYQVHPRRNDRFLRHAPALAQLYPRIDFTEFTYTRHMLAALRGAAPLRFDRVRRELQAAWRPRMAQILEAVEAPALVLDLQTGLTGPLGAEPPFVTAGMVAEAAGRRKVLRVDVAPLLGEAHLDGMVFHDLEWAVACRQMTPPAHAKVHDAVRDALAEVL
jgi:hypothetical protein